MSNPDLWKVLGAAVASILAYLGGRAAADATSAGAWRQLLEPYREEQERLWDRVAALEKDNAVLTVQREADRQELGTLRRKFWDQAIRTTSDSAVVRTTLADAGFPVPEIPVATVPPLERTRATDQPR